MSRTGSSARSSVTAPDASGHVDLQGRRVLIVSPTFFGYEKRIQTHLHTRGATSLWIDERPSNEAWAKALTRLSPALMAPYAARYYRDALAKLRGSGFDDVLFMSPEACTPSIVRSFRRQFPSSRLILYMYDSFANKSRRNPAEFVSLFDRSLTFDADDAQRYDIPFRPLFYSDTLGDAAAAKPEFAFSFVGTVHSDRYRILRRLCRQMDDAGLRYFAYPYVPSRLVYYAYRLRKPEFWGTEASDLRFDPLPYADVLAAMAKSVAVLDVEHPQQRGLTMRTLEVLGAGRKLITTNANVRRYPFYSEDRIWVLDRREPSVDPEFLDATAPPVPRDFARTYSLQGWLDDVLA